MTGDGYLHVNFIRGISWVYLKNTSGVSAEGNAAALIQRFFVGLFGRGKGLAPPSLVTPAVSTASSIRASAARRCDSSSSLGFDVSILRDAMYAIGEEACIIPFPA